MNRFGAAIRSEWSLDPDFLTVNHGSYGATPRQVLAAQTAWRARLESQPTRFMATQLPAALRAAAARLAAFLGADSNDLAFVDNATTGCCAVLRSLRLSPGQEILTTTHVYDAVRNTIRHVTDLAGARMVEVEVPFPDFNADTLLARLAAALTPRTRLAVIDHITSPSALILPVERIVAACHQAGVPVLIDGAHAPGMIPLDLTALDADYYTGNVHKWLFAPKGSAFLWARADRQPGLHPPVLSRGYGCGFLAEFDWTGTRDPSAYLATPDALAFHAKLGGPALMDRNVSLAREAAELLAARLSTQAVLGGAAMSLVRLPLQGPIDPPRALALRADLLARGIDAPVHCLAGQAWLRLSVQAYNDIDDYKALAVILTAACKASNHRAPKDHVATAAPPCDAPPVHQSKAADMTDPEPKPWEARQTLAGAPYHTLLSLIHDDVVPASYFEIGAHQGASLALARSLAVAVDPAFRLDRDILGRKPACHLMQCTSDDFFARHNLADLLGGPVDLAFLDGFHHFEYLLRDIINTERYCDARSVVAVHDCLPTDAHVGRRDINDWSMKELSANPGYWAGDVWKALVVIKRLRSDITMTCFDAAPTGLVFLTRLNPGSRLIIQDYADACADIAEMTILDYGVHRFFAEMDVRPADEFPAFLAIHRPPAARPAQPEAVS